MFGGMMVLPRLSRTTASLLYPYRVRWLDYRGNEVRSIYAGAGESFSDPVAPAFDGLTFSGWSGSSTNIQSDIDIIADYAPTDGKRTLHVEASALVGLTPTLKIVKSDTSTLTVDWGDGTTSTSSASGNVTIVKAAPYATGAYRIKPYISNGSGTFSGGFGTSGNTMLSGVAVTEYWATADVTSVSAYAFSGQAFRTMSYATGFVSATSIGAYALQGCSALVSFSAPLATSIGAYALQGCAVLVSFSAPLATSIGAYALQACTVLVSFSAPLATSIGANALQYCYALVSFSAPLATSIGANALQACAALVSFSAPLATSIGANALQNCRNVSQVTLGPNCTLIDSLALDGSRNLRTLTVQATTPPTLASVATLTDYDPRLLIRVPAASVETYKAATNWSAFAGRIVGY